MDAGDAIAAQFIHNRKFAPNHDRCVRLRDHHVHARVGAAADGECRVHRAVGVQTGEMIPRLAVHGREAAADNYLPVRRDAQRVYRVIGAGTRVEARVQRAVRVEPGDMIA